MHGEVVLQCIPSVRVIGMLNKFSEFAVLCILSCLKMRVQKQDLQLNFEWF